MFENNMFSINSCVVFLTEISNMTSKWGKPNYKDGTVTVLNWEHRKTLEATYGILEILSYKN